MLIADMIVEKIYSKMHKVMREGKHRPEFLVYMGRDKWMEMMAELQGRVSSGAFTLIESKGRRIVGFPIYQVADEGHGIRIFEDV